MQRVRLGQCYLVTYRVTGIVDQWAEGNVRPTVLSKNFGVKETECAVRRRRGYIVKETRFTGSKSPGSKIRMGQYVLCQRDMMFSVKVTRCIVPQSCSFKKTVST